MRQVVQPADQPAQVTTRVTIRVDEQIDLHTVDDGLPIPTIRHEPDLPVTGSIRSAVHTSPVQALWRGDRPDRTITRDYGAPRTGTTRATDRSCWRSSTVSSRLPWWSSCSRARCSPNM